MQHNEIIFKINLPNGEIKKIKLTKDIPDNQVLAWLQTNLNIINPNLLIYSNTICRLCFGNNIPKSYYKALIMVPTQSGQYYKLIEARRTD